MTSAIDAPSPNTAHGRVLGLVAAVTGAGGQLGQLVLQRLAADRAFSHVIAVDRDLVPVPAGSFEVRRFDLGADVEAVAAM
jgi:uncharacterized protein YbjT (DUF2867 family)